MLAALESSHLAWIGMAAVIVLTMVMNLGNLQQQPTWKSTAVIVTYDDSDGWYDHQMGPLANQSTGPADALTGPNACGTASNALPGIDATNTHALGLPIAGEPSERQRLSGSRSGEPLWMCGLHTWRKSCSDSIGC
jgi:phospholipase C